MKLFSWLRAPDDEIKQARRETRESRGRLAESVTKLDEHRHLLDQMVQDSLKMMEPRK